MTDPTKPAAESSPWCCDGCDAVAIVSMVMVDSQSPSNCVYGCADCAHHELEAWLFGLAEASDTAGWEVRWITDDAAVPSTERAAPFAAPADTPRDPQ